MSDLVLEVEVDRATPDEWSAMLDQFEDANLYQTWAYGAVRWGSKNLSHLVLKRNGDVVAMAQLRIVRPTNFKFGIAYLRWGPLCHRRGELLEPEIVREMTRALEEEYVGKRKLLLRILPNAFVGSPRAGVLQSALRGFTQELSTHSNTYRTLLLDLAPPIEELRKNLDKKWRNALTRSEKNGLKVICGSGTEEYRTFCQMYDQMRKRKAFETSVDVDEFGRIQQDLPERQRMRVMICLHEGTPVAGIVSSAMGDSANYLLGATSDQGLTYKGAYLLQWTQIQWLKENNFKWYDLGGIDPERNPGVYHFKSGLSGMDVRHLSSFVACKSVFTSTIITSGEAVYRALRGCMSRLRRTHAVAQPATSL
jgi:lipid II:glycine glycyltransferase (peptidoglycan interpeptide bridge formation enzyme)